jgi:integrase
MQLPAPRIRTDTVEALIAAWHKSPEWLTLADKTRLDWQRYCDRIIDAWGPLEVRGISPRAVLALRDSYQHAPASANNMLRCLSSMLGWSVPREWRDNNPCREVKPLKAGEGYAPWPWEVIQAAEQELRPDLWWAVALALYTGQRLGDCLAMRWSAINPAGLIAVRQEKTGKDLLIPVHRDLKTIIDAIPRRAVTILTSANGTPWLSGFQATWGKHKPALVRSNSLVFHGLRKSAVVTLLEAGCTDAEVGAVTGQTRQMVEHYGKLVNQERLAKAAILRWENIR